MIKHFIVLVKLALLASCNPAASSAADENGQQYLVGYLLREDAPKICTLRFHLEPFAKRDIYQIIDRSLPKYTFDTGLLVTAIGYGRKSFIDLSSAEFCQYSNSVNPDVTFFSDVANDVTYQGEFRKAEPEQILKQYDMDSFSLSEEPMRSSSCVKELKVDFIIDPLDINELRHRYAIPLALFGGSSSEDLFLFDSQCDKSEEFISDMVHLGFPRKNEDLQKRVLNPEGS